MEIKLTDNDVDYLLALCKEVLQQYNIQLEETCKGSIKITSTNLEKSFILNYFVRPGKITLNFRETESNLCLIRINLNDGFHKNSNNEIVRGNRINIFSEEEYIKKNDGSTYMRAYALPYKIFEDNYDFVKQLFTLLEYTKTQHNDNINIETNLFLRW
ncbi:DUF6978 family protein [Staphylococcus intermedius]|uniref:Uncharacterized protein n=1 Tax=Staphylococcus intermedius NCTC 11048 TaxID=1141106 RepID=A0A380G8F6_STAIN|nr:hypothetical protein [Staphylococcus intermedius]PCF65409.1 hypothetical protein B5C04_04985 [Staphylococcus intermedius]PCF81087.1 hypothetical protein B4W74_05335 [Staphylococcus intermedius]PCF82369.1 hypothetical protein B4W70_04980 [Staphylococcus intermedius]PCF87070.1 hypothetical protein B4W75_08250 [Staphylococcus intermedius]PNZ54261.1 hypothetical protein CD138_03065 [Staphylococcus intermedius NCTC 11048]